MKEFVMFPDEREQNLIINMSAEDLAKAFVDQSNGDAKLSLALVYDVLYALEDREKATKMLKIFIDSFGDKKVAKEAAMQVEFRVMWDNQPREDQQDFVLLCEDVGLTLPVIKAGGKG